VYFRIRKKNKNTGGNKLLTDTNNLPEYVFTGKKFLRREDITEAIRAHIAVRELADFKILLICQSSQGW